MGNPRYEGSDECGQRGSKSTSGDGGQKGKDDIIQAGSANQEAQGRGVKRLVRRREEVFEGALNLYKRSSR